MIGAVIFIAAVVYLYRVVSAYLRDREKEKYIREALKPGAGLDYVSPPQWDAGDSRYVRGADPWPDQISDPVPDPVLSPKQHLYKALRGLAPMVLVALALMIIVAAA